MEKRVALVLVASLMIVCSAFFSSAASFTLFNNSNPSQAPYFTVNGTTGYIGIGTISPSNLLHLSGTVGVINIDDTGAAGTPGAGILFKRSAAQKWLIQSDALSTSTDQLEFLNANGNSRVTILQGGNVGIGTTTPSMALDVRGDGNFSGTIYLKNGTEILNYINTNIAGNSTSGDSNGTSTYVPYVGANKNTHLGIYNLTTMGMVGIGTSSPSQHLSINDGGDFAIPALGADGGAFSIKTGGVRGLLMGNNGTKFFMQVQRTDGSATAYDLLLQPNGGNVGIGTTTPSSKLEVAGNLAFSGASNRQILMNTSSDTASQLDFDFSPTLASQSGLFRFFRSTNTSGTTAISVYKSDGTNSENSRIGGNVNSFLNALVGNVGIGTTAPSTRLDVNGSLRVQGTGNFSGTVYVNNGTDVLSLVSSVNASSSTWNVSGSNIYPRDLSYNVGIGTANPSHKLSVAGTVNISAGTAGLIVDSSGRLVTGGFANINMSNVSGQIESWSTGSALELVKTAGAATDPIFVAWGDTSSNTKTSERFRINRGGNVGIGTNNPNEELHLYGNGDQYVKTQSANAGEAGFIINASNTQWRLYQPAGSTDLRINNAGTDRISFETNGYVGIGTTAPNQMLDVRGDGNFSGTIYLKNGTEIFSYINTVTAGNSSGGTTNATDTYVPYVGSSKNVVLGAYNFTVDTNVLHVDATNNRVGIRTTTPNATLHIAGAAGSEAGDYLVDYRFPNDGSIANKALLLFPIPNVASGAPLSKMNGVLSLVRGSTSSSPRNNNYYVSATYSYGSNPEVSITPLSNWDPVLRAVECTYSGEQYLTLNLTHLYADWPGTASVYFTGYYVNNNNSQKPEVINSSLCTSPSVLKDVNSFGGSISVDNSGNVGIETTSPAARLDVNGNARIQGIGNFSGTVYLNNGTEILAYINTNIAGNTTGSTGNETATYVPYVGANKALNLGTFNLSANGIDVATGAQFGSGNVNLIDSTGKIAGISSTYFASLDGSTLTNLNAGNIGSGTLLPARLSGTPGTYAIDPFMYANGVAHSTLGSATIGEQAISSLYTQNKIQFAVPYSVEYTSDGSTWEQYPYASANSSTIRSMFIGYNTGQGIKINGTESWRGIRLIFEAKSYSYLNNLYVYQSTNGHSANISIYKSWGSDITNMSVVASNSSFNGWPGHTMITHSTIAWNNNPTPGTHSKYVAVYIYPNWNPTYPNNNIDIYSIDWWGQYPANNRPLQLFGWDYNQNVNFNNGTTWTGTGAKLGVGTSSPQAKLEVWGDIATRSDSDDWLLQYSRLDGTQNGGIKTFNNNNPQTGLAFYTMNTSRLAIDRSGNVGIGTTTPSRALDVRGVGNFSGTVYVNNNTDVLGIITSVNATATTWNISGGSLFPEDLSYNVGIGTATPQTELHVNGTFSATNLSGTQGLYQNNNGAVVIGQVDTTSAGIKLKLFGDTSTQLRFSRNGNFDVGPSADANPALLFTNNTGSEIARITAAGYVGIGTVSPSTRLDVNGSMRVQGIGNFSGTVYINNVTDISSLVSSSDDWNVSGSNLFPKDLSYKLGIGTNSPGATLDVEGRTTQFSNTAAVYRWYFGGAQDTNWKGIANVSFGAGVYEGVSFKVDIMDAMSNAGGSVSVAPMTYFVMMRGNDAGNNSAVSGPFQDYVRSVKTGAGKYELQVRQTTDWRHMQVEVQQISSCCGTAVVSYVDSPTNGSISGTIYNATTVDTKYFANVASRGNTSVVGYLGIGVTSPNQSRLQLSGSGNYDATIRLTNTGTGGGDWSIISTDSAWGAGGGKLLFATPSPASAYARMAIDSNGNVGIGLTDPAARLHINQTAAATGLYLEGGISGNDLAHFARRNGATVDINISGHSGEPQIIFGVGGASKYSAGYDAAGGFQIAAGTTLAEGTNRFYIQDNTGYVGIGTVSPSTRFDVNGSMRVQGIGNFSGTVYINNGTDIAALVQSAATSSPFSNTSTQVQIRAGFPSTLNISNFMFANSTNVGIGTANPTSPLTVSDLSLNSANQMLGLFSGNRDDGNSVKFEVRNVNASNTAFSAIRLTLGESGTEGGAILASRAANNAYGIVNGVTFSPISTSQDIGFRTGAAQIGGTAAGPSMIITSTGNVGVNTSSPQAKLHVQGDVILNASATGGNVVIQL